MAESSPELLNHVYREISEKMGMDIAMEIYRIFHLFSVLYLDDCFDKILVIKALHNQCFVITLNGDHHRIRVFFPLLPEKNAIEYNASRGRNVQSKHHA